MSGVNRKDAMTTTRIVISQDSLMDARAEAWTNLSENLLERAERVKVAVEVLTAYIQVAAGRLAAHQPEGARNAEELVLDVTVEVMDALRSLAEATSAAADKAKVGVPRHAVLDHGRTVVVAPRGMR